MNSVLCTEQIPLVLVINNVGYWCCLQLDFKVGWKKLKEVFGMAGVVKRADVKEDKDGKSRGMGTVTFEQPLEAVQAICILHM